MPRYRTVLATSNRGAGPARALLYDRLMPGLTVTTRDTTGVGVKQTHGIITFDSSYPTGGEAITAANVGLPFIHKLELQARTGGYVAQYDRANKKVKVFRAPGGAGLKAFAAVGAAAGNVTATGVLATDTIVAVLTVDTGAASGAGMTTLTSEFAVCAADTIGNAAGTSTANKNLIVIVARPTADAPLVEVPSTTDLALVVFEYTATYFENGTD
jgi:hypothetical protein